VRLAQIFSNLLNNAAKFTPVGGRIELDVRADDGEAVVSVRDTGVGFGADEHERIFELFVQLDPSRTQAAGGLGVGLTLARSLVEMHGGRIAARSDGPGLGATFTVQLPRVSAPANVPFELALAGRVPVRRRVLVVDDNVDAASSLAAMLRLEGLDAREAHDGVAALELARHFEPDVAFVDLNMPGMNGTALAAELRAQPWATELHLVALTGMGQKSDVEATRAAGFDAHLTKPAAPDDLLAHARGMAEAGDALRAAG
jgi:CheY-like chemotaxis protein